MFDEWFEHARDGPSPAHRGVVTDDIARTAVTKAPLPVTRGGVRAAVSGQTCLSSNRYAFKKCPINCRQRVDNCNLVCRLRVDSSRAHVFARKAERRFR